MIPSEASTDPDHRESGPTRAWVVGVDGSANARQALTWAARVADGRDVVLHAVGAWQYPYLGVLPLVGSAIPAFDEDMGRVIERDLGAVSDEIAVACGVRIETTMVLGPATQVLLEALERADLAVVGSRGRGGFMRLVLGSVGHQLSTHAPRPVIIVPEDTDRLGLGRVVIGVDGSDNSIAALRWAHDFAPTTSELVALGVGEPPASPHEAGDPAQDAERSEDRFTLAVARAEASIAAPGRFQRIFESGHARHRLIERAGNADLLVVGERGHRGVLAGVLGSVTTWVIHHLVCPTAVIPAPGPSAGT